MTGSVVATDLDVHRLTDLPSNVEARRHDILADDLERGAYDLVHGRAVLQHLSDPEAGLTRMANAVAPGGWLVIEENDLGLFTMSGPPQAARATAVMHDLTSRWAAAGALDGFFGRQVPGLVHALGFDAFAVDTAIGVGTRDEPAYEAMRLAWPQLRRVCWCSWNRGSRSGLPRRRSRLPIDADGDHGLAAAWAQKPV